MHQHACLPIFLPLFILVYAYTHQHDALPSCILAFCQHCVTRRMEESNGGVGTVWHVVPPASTRVLVWVNLLLVRHLVYCIISSVSLHTNGTHGRSLPLLLGFSCALDLVKYIRENHGDYFCLSVAGYPEG